MHERHHFDIPDDACVITADGEDLIYPEHDFPPAGEAGECRRCGAEPED